mgnify:CR=1 FL=1
MKNWAVILGASSGIGLECALRLAKKGINIYGLYLRKKSSDVEKIITEINKIIKLLVTAANIIAIVTSVADNGAISVSIMLP